MKVSISMKCPDAVENAIDYYGLNEEEAINFKEMVKKYFRWGEMVEIEFDLETGEATVKPQ